MNEHKDDSTLSALKERLATLSPSEIAGEMEAYLDGMTEEDYDPAVMDAYLDALDQRAPMPCTFDPNRSYAEFQARLRTFLPEEAISPDQAPSAPRAQKGRRGRLPLRRVLVVAAAVTLLLGSMAVVQAGENSILGRVGAWTGDEFWFPSGDTAANYEAFRQALVDHGLPEELAPGWFPKRFMSDEPKVREDDSGLEISISLKTAGSDQRCFVTISRRSGPAGAEEEEEGSYELYTSNGREFRLHIYSDRAFGAWKEGGLEVTIGGNITKKELKSIIDSMEPVRMEQEASVNAALAESFRRALAEHGLPEELTPTWFPDGFQSGEPEFLENAMGITVHLPVTNEKDGRFCYVSVDRYYDPASIGERIYEKDDTPVEQYTRDGRTFYILSNINRHTGTWSEDDIVMTIGGQLTRDELKSIIDSIEPPRQEASANAALAESFRQALAEHGLPEELTPTWFPDGFRAGEPEFLENAMGFTVHLSMDNVKDGRHCHVSVDRYYDPSTINDLVFQKDDDPVILYTANDRTFYLLSNLNTVTGAWAQDDIVIVIGGQLSMEELKMIIDSIGSAPV